MRKIIYTTIFFLNTALCFLFAVSCVEKDTFFREEENLNQTKKQKEQKNSDVKFSFIVTGDNDSINDVYKEIIKQTNESDAKFLINVGDITNGSSEYKFEEFKNFMNENMKKPYYVVIGDNDILEETGKDGFIKYFEKLYYSFDYENAHFIILDNAGYKERFSDEQLEWLKDDLEQNKKPLTFIFMHRPINPPFAQLFDYDQEKEIKNKNQKFLDIIKNYKISEIYCGHIHSHIEYTLDDDTPVTVTGGAGSAFQLNDSNSAYYHYVKVNVDGERHTNVVVEIKKYLKTNFN